jgi:hypothetical protein
MLCQHYHSFAESSILSVPSHLYHVGPRSPVGTSRPVSPCPLSKLVQYYPGIQSVLCLVGPVSPVSPVGPVLPVYPVGPVSLCPLCVPLSVQYYLCILSVLSVLCPLCLPCPWWDPDTPVGPVGPAGTRITDGPGITLYLPCTPSVHYYSRVQSFQSVREYRFRLYALVAIPLDQCTVTPVCITRRSSISRVPVGPGCFPSVQYFPSDLVELEDPTKFGSRHYTYTISL